MPVRTGYMRSVEQRSTCRQKATLLCRFGGYESAPPAESASLVEFGGL